MSSTDGPSGGSGAATNAADTTNVNNESNTTTSTTTKVDDGIGSASRTTNVLGEEPSLPPEAGHAGDVPAKTVSPIMRSVLQLSCNITGFNAHILKGPPGVTAGLLYKGKPYSYCVGWRDRARGLDLNDKGNHLRLRDPVGGHYLSIPVTAQLVWWLHKQGHMDADKPITHTLTELPTIYDRLTPRDLLTYRVGVDDTAVYKSLGLSIPSALSLPMHTAAQRCEMNLWDPLRKKFGQLDGAKPQECRHNVVEYLKKQGESLPRVRKMDTGWKIKPSHFGFCLLAAAIERTMKQPFEELMLEKVFKPAGSVSAGYGVPTTLAKSGQFFQQSAGCNAHYAWYNKTTLPVGDVRTAAPTIFNPSLNFFASAEDFGFLVCCACVVTMGALKTFEQPTKFHPFIEWGVKVDPRTNILSMTSPPFTTVDAMPWCASFHYNTEKDVGGFAVGNCGNARSRAIINATAYVNELMFTKQVLDEGVDPEDEEASKEVYERLQKQVESNPFKKFFKSDAYTRF